MRLKQVTVQRPKGTRQYEKHCTFYSWCAVLYLMSFLAMFVCAQCSYSQTIHPGVVKPLKSESLAELCGLMPYSFYGIFYWQWQSILVKNAINCLSNFLSAFPYPFLCLYCIQNFSLQKILHYMLSFFTWDSAFNNLQ